MHSERPGRLCLLLQHTPRCVTTHPRPPQLEELAAQVARACAVPKDGRDRLRLVAKGQPVTEAVLRQLHDGGAAALAVRPAG